MPDKAKVQQLDIFYSLAGSVILPLFWQTCDMRRLFPEIMQTQGNCFRSSNKVPLGRTSLGTKKIMLVARKKIKYQIIYSSQFVINESILEVPGKRVKYLIEICFSQRGVLLRV